MRVSLLNAGWVQLRAATRALRRAPGARVVTLLGLGAGVVSATTALRRVRATLGEQLELARKLTMDVEEGVVDVDERGRVAYLNLAAARMLLVEREDAVDRSFHELVHLRHGERAHHGEDCPPLSPLREGRPLEAVDPAFQRADGTEFSASYTSSPVVRRGRVAGTVVTFRDATAHLRAEEAQRFLERATRIATESIDWEATLTHVARLAVPFLGDLCAVVLQDERGLRVVATAHADAARSAELRELLERYPLDPEATHGPAWVVRHARAELLPEVDLDAFAAGADDQAPVRREILAALGLRSYLAVPLVTRDRTLGALLFGLCASGRRHGPHDLEVAQELAARCALAIEHARLYREAQEATRAREEILAVVSHDLRTPISAVQLAAGLVASRIRASGAPELQKCVETLRSAASRATRLVNDLVDSARLEGGRLTLERGTHAASDLAREALAIAQPAAERQGVRLSLDVAPDAGAVDCDAHRVLQVLSNLLGNSLNVMPAGGALRLTVARAGREVAFAVSDTGPGIAPEDQPHVFERYWRSAEPTYGGSGLGLAIARGIVEAHGGKIAVRSSPGEGATFTFTLPAVGS